MKTARIRKENKKVQEINVEEEYSVKKMLIITGILIIIFGAFYLITTIVVKENKVSSDISNPSVIDSTKIILSNLLNQKDSEYYVLATKNNNSTKTGFTNVDYTKIYNNYIKDYTEKEGSLSIYKVNLDDALNKNYISDKNNITDDLTKLKISDDVLFKIKDGKIENHYIGNSKIVEILSKL